MRLDCPRCKIPLVRQKNRKLVFWACTKCEGRTASVGLLRSVCDRESIGELWSKSAKSVPTNESLRCPSCAQPMVAVSVAAGSGEAELDVCRPCMFVWFDKGELQHLPAGSKTPTPANSLSLEVKKEIATAQVQLMGQLTTDREASNPGPDTIGGWIAGILGMPVEGGNAGLSRWPFATWIIGALMVVATLAAMVMGQSAYYAFGLVPADWIEFYGVSFITSFFIHGGIFHVVGNLYFLLVFGDDVEDLIGVWRYVGMLFIATVVGDVAHIAVDPDSTIPCVGASGGISGVLAFYVLEYPWRPMRFLIMPFHYGYGRWISVPAAALFGVWCLYQIVGAVSRFSDGTSVSYVSHIGGSLVGILLWLVHRNR